MVGLYILSFFIFEILSGIELLLYSDKIEKIYKDNKEKKELNSYIYFFGFVNFIIGLGGILVGLCFFVELNDISFNIRKVVMLFNSMLLGFLYNRLIIRVLCKDKARVKQILDCKKRLNDIESQLKNIETMKESIYYDYTLLKEDRIKQIEELNNSQMVLKKAYNELMSGLNALQLVDTFTAINKYSLTEETKEELHKQIDIFHATKELKG